MDVKEPSFADLIRDIEAEAKAEGPEAVAELEDMRRHYGSVGQELARELEGPAGI